LVRKYALVFTDTNSLLRLLYAIATARHRGQGTPLRLLLESGRLQVLVTEYIVKEAERKLPKLVTKRAVSHWDMEPSEILNRLREELENMLRTEQVVPVDADETAYARIRRAVEERSNRQIALRHRGWLLHCVAREACRKNIGKDLPVVEGILLAYDVAAAVPASSRAGITRPPFPVVTDDRDLFCSLYKCLRRRNLDRLIVLIRYDTFRELIPKWTTEGEGISDDEMYRWCLSRHCNGARHVSSQP